jgi:hypothetical protein
LKVAKSVNKRAAELERLVKESAETVKNVLRDYRDTVRASSSKTKGSPRSRDRARLDKKRVIVERANAQYMRLQKELDRIRSRMQATKS